MKDAVKKELTKSLRKGILQVREMSIFTDDGRMFLDASAMLYGASVNNKNEIIKEDGSVMSQDEPDYKSIVNSAKKQARAESRIGSDIIGS